MTDSTKYYEASAESILDKNVLQIIKKTTRYHFTNTPTRDGMWCMTAIQAQKHEKQSTHFRAVAM